MNDWLTLGIWLPLSTYLVVELLAYWALARDGAAYFLDHSVDVAFIVVEGGAILSFLWWYIKPQSLIFTQLCHAVMNLSLSSEFWLITLVTCSMIGFILIAMGVNDHRHIVLTSLFTFFYLFFSVGEVLSPTTSIVATYTGWTSCLVIVSIAGYFFASATPYARRLRENRRGKILRHWFAECSKTELNGGTEE